MSQPVDKPERSAPRPEYDPGLPISAHCDEIVALIREHPVVVIAGETGSGKTTQLPKMCLDAGRGQAGQVGCTQPRRIAARAMAERVAEELGCELGREVGYQVRFRDRSSPEGFIRFMTDGILLAESARDPLLRGYDTLIIDEAHERSLNIDFLLGYLHRLLPRRPDLRVVITSATIDTEKFSRHFGDAPVLEVSGRGHPVEVRYRPLDDDADQRDLYQGIADAIRELDRVDRRGDVLVFLSGEKEIRETREFLTRQGLRDTEVVPLYARLSAAEQHRVFHPGAQRRVVLATNVAETSLTVPRIRFVIDSGLARISRYTHASRVQRLPIEPVSQASANQRMGRCGRLGPGTCIRLYSEDDFAARPEFTEPEILRTSLASVALRMLTSGLGDMEDFPFVDSPAPRMVRDAYRLLDELGATRGGRQLTRLGRGMARWPIDVRLARVVLEGDRRGCLEPALVLAAVLSIQDPRERPLDAREAADEAHERFSDPASDFAALLKLWEYLRRQRRAHSGNQFRKLCRREFLAWQRVLEWFDLHQQLRDIAREEGLALKAQSSGGEAIHKALLSGFLSQVGRRLPEDPGYQGVRSRTFRVFPGSGLFGRTPPWIVAAEIVETSRTWARVCARIEPEWIEQVAAHQLKQTHSDPHWSRRRGRVMVWEQVSLFGLVVVEKRRVAFADIDPTEARRVFIREALVRGELDLDAPFMRHNEALRGEVRQLEHKRRRHDVLADEDALFDFYDARLPDDVHSALALAEWLAGLAPAQQETLHAGLDVLLRENAGEAPVTAFPDHLERAGARLPLVYRFAPGEVDDGVTVQVPLERLNALDPGDLQWLVPGRLRDKIVALVRGLPRPLRRALAPAPQFADAALAELSGQRGGPLVDALASELGRLSRLDLAADDFDEPALADEFRMRIEVYDDDGEMLAASRDLAALQERFGQRARRAFMDQQDPGLRRDGETTWTFGTIPESVTGRDGAPAFPALVDQGEAVGLRLFETPEDAALAHADGVLRLLMLTLRQRLDDLERRHGLSRAAQVAWSTEGSVTELVRQLAEAVLHDVSLQRVTVRDDAGFAELVATSRAALGRAFTEAASELDAALVTWHQARRELGQRRWPEALVADIEAQLADLVYPGFVADLAPGRLQHYPRYLQAVCQRLEKARTDPAGDQRRQADVAPWWQRYLDWLEAGGDYDLALDRYRWLVEEFRVSIFAQPLGTAEKVSPQRLDEAWSDAVGDA